MQLTPLSHSQNVEQGRQELLQKQFPDLHESSEAEPPLNTLIISSGTKKISGATGKGRKYLISPSFPHP